MNDTSNHARLSGLIAAAPTLSHETNGEKFFATTLNVPRLSEIEDAVPILLSERLLAEDSFNIGDMVDIDGQFRSYSIYEPDGTHRLKLAAFATRVLKRSTTPGHYCNELFLNGFICKKPVYRTTPFGREITDLLIIDALFDGSVTKHAYNAVFEWYCLSKHFGLNELDMRNWIPQWQDTMLHAAYCSFPGSLANAGAALGLPQELQKDSIGKSLIRLFCVPQKPTKTNGGRTRTMPYHEPEKWELFKEYNRQDVITEMEMKFAPYWRTWCRWTLKFRLGL